MRDKGAVPVHLHRRPRPVRRARHRLRARPRRPVRRRDRPRWSTAAARWSRRAWPRSPAARSTSAPAAGPTSTPPRSAGPSPAPCWCARCTRTASRSGATARPSRATTSSGSTATACSPTPTCGSTSRGWTPTSSPSSAAAHEMSEWLTAHDLPYRDSQEKAYSTDANIWGATHEAKTLEHLDVVDGDRRADHGRAVLGPRGRDRDRGRHGPLRAGPPGRHQRHDVRSTRSPWSHEANAIGGRHGLGMSDQIENRIIEAKSRGIYEAPGMALLLHRLRAAGQRDPQRGHPRQLPHRGPPARPAALRGPLARPAGADAARVAAALGRLAVTGEVTLRLRRGEDYSILRHPRPGLQLPPGQAVDGAHRGRRLRPDRPDRPADHAQPRHRRLPRQAGAVRRPAARPGPGARRARHPVRRAARRRRRPDRRQPRRRRATDDDALDHAAMEFGTD